MFNQKNTGSNMIRITLRFYGELNMHLPLLLQQRSFVNTCNPKSTVKDLLESLVIPCEEVDLIVANNKPVSFDYTLQPNDRISLYPVFRSIDITPLNLINRGSLH